MISYVGHRTQVQKAIGLRLLSDVSNTMVRVFRKLDKPTHEPLESFLRSDNDQYSHINNSIYYHLFDSIVNSYLIEHCGLQPNKSPLIGLVVSSFCQVCLSSKRNLIETHLTQFFAPLSFPQVLELGLRVDKLGRSSVTYEVGVFEEGKNVPAAVGGYTHVFVDSQSRTSTAMARETKAGLQKLLIGVTQVKTRL